MNCPDCTAAAERIHHGFHMACVGCCARAAARSPHFDRVRQAGKQDRKYRAMLTELGITHEEVREASKVDALGRVAA